MDQSNLLTESGDNLVQENGGLLVLEKNVAVSLSPLGGVGAQFFDNNGVPLVGGKIHSYQSGTTSPLETYTSKSATASHTNPIILDAGGRVPGGEIWLTDGQLYKFSITTSTDTLIGTYDNIGGGGFNSSITVVVFAGDGTDTTFNLASTPSSENTTNVYINGVYQQKDTYSVLGQVLTFSEAPPYQATIEINYI